MTPPRRASSLAAQLTPVLLGHVCVHAAMTGGRMAIPLLALSMGYSTVATGVLVALFAVTQIFLSLPAGRFADRHGLKRPMGLSVLGVSLGAGLAAAWPVYGVLCLTALLCGGAVGLATITLQRHVGRMAQTPTELKQVFSWLSIAPAFSNFLGPFAAGLMIDHFGFRASFVLLACLPLVAWLMLRNASELPREPLLAAHGGAAWDLLRDAKLRRLLLINWFMTGSWDLHSFMVPVLGHERGLSASLIGSILGAFAIGATFIRLVLPLFAPRVKEWVLICCAMATIAPLFALYPFISSALAMGACSAAIGMAFGVVTPMIMSMLHQVSPCNRQGEAFALRLIMVNISSAGMPLLIGAAAGLIGVSGVFWTAGLVLGIGTRLGVGLRGIGSDGADSVRR